MSRIIFSLVLLVPVAIASAGDPPSPRKHVPPKVAFDACAKAKIGDTCTFKTPRRGRDVTGTCQTPADNGPALVCHVDWKRGSGAGSAH